MQQSHQGILVSFASIPAISNTFNPLFKVLFIFPSWYLFAIGLAHIFSCRWNLPPILRSSPKERDSTKSAVHNDMHMTHRTFTFLKILFQEVFMCTFVGHSSPKNNSRLRAPIPMLCLFMFIRHYSWNPIWFPILHLLICLNSVGVPTWCHILTMHPEGCRGEVAATNTTYAVTGNTLQVVISVSVFQPINDQLTLMCTNIHRLQRVNKVCILESWSKFACRNIPEASHTFKSLLVHRNLQFTMFIALRCTLHRRPSRDICCWKCCLALPLQSDIDVAHHSSSRNLGIPE
jgi:hypothetical protein